MVLLTELLQTPSPGDLQRRWFTSETMDLVIWQNADSEIQAFQLCHGKPLREHALEWKRGGELTHFIVDDGSLGSTTHKATPVLKNLCIPDISPDVLQQFEEDSQSLPSDIAGFVLRHLQRVQEST